MRLTFRAIALGAMVSARPVLAQSAGSDGGPESAAPVAHDTDGAAGVATTPARSDEHESPRDDAKPAAPVCLLGHYPEKQKESALTAADLVCDELRKRGIAVGAPVTEAPPESTAYVVHLQQLGNTLVFRLNYESPLGTPRSSRRINLSGIEEVEKAAPRLAEAVVEDKPLAETERFGNLVGDESARPTKRKGDLWGGIAVTSLSLPSSDKVLGAGFGLFGYYESESWAAGLTYQFGDADIQGRRATQGAFSVGGRLFFLPSDISPFIGTGFGYSSIVVEQDGLSGQGVGMHGEAGVELFRLYSVHLFSGLRADFPFYRLRSDTQGSRYEVPLTFLVGIGVTERI